MVVGSFSQLHSLEEVLRVVGLAGLGDVLLDGEVEDGHQEVQVGQAAAPPRVVVPEVLVFLVDAPDFGWIGGGVLWILRVLLST